MYLLIYLRTQWSWDLLEKLTGFQVVKKFLSFYRTWKFITTFTSTCVNISHAKVLNAHSLLHSLHSVSFQTQAYVVWKYVPTQDTTFRNSICFVADDSLDAVDVLGPIFVFGDLWLEPRFEKWLATLKVDFRDFLSPANKCSYLFSVHCSQLAYHIYRVEKVSLTIWRFFIDVISWIFLTRPNTGVLINP